MSSLRVLLEGSLFGGSFPVNLTLDLTDNLIWVFLVAVLLAVFFLLGLIATALMKYNSIKAQVAGVEKNLLELRAEIELAEKVLKEKKSSMSVEEAKRLEEELGKIDSSKMKNKEAFLGEQSKMRQWNVVEKIYSEGKED